MAFRLARRSVPGRRNRPLSEAGCDGYNFGCTRQRGRPAVPGKAPSLVHTAPSRKFLMKRTALTLACLALLAAAAPVHAKGDAGKGKALAYTCTGCHGIPDYKNAYPSYRVPKIAGQDEQYLVAALDGYRKGERSHPTMQAQAQSFSEQEIADIAAYLSSLKRAKK